MCRQALLLARTCQRDRVSEITAEIESAASRVAIDQRRNMLKKNVCTQARRVAT